MEKQQTLSEYIKEIKKEIGQHKAKQNLEKDLDDASDILFLMKEARAKANITQPDLQWETGIVQQTISAIDRGVTNPRISTVKRYLAACGVDLEKVIRQALLDAPQQNRKTVYEECKLTPFENLFVWKQNLKMGATKTQIEGTFYGTFNVRVRFHKELSTANGIVHLLYVHEDDIHKIDSLPIADQIQKWDSDNETHRSYMEEELSDKAFIDQFR